MQNFEVIIPEELEAEVIAAAPTVDPASRGVPRITWNLKTEDAHGEPTREDRLYITDENEPLEYLDLTPLEVVRLGASWSETDGGERTLHCMSYNRRTARRTEDAPEAPGELVECEPCGRMAWVGRQKPTCTRFEEVAWVDDTGRVLLTRFRVTALQAWRKFMKSTYLGKHKRRDGTRGDYPLPVFRVRLRAVMASKVIPGETRRYAVPTFEVIGTSPDLAPMLRLRGEVVAEMESGPPELPAPAPAPALPPPVEPLPPRPSVKAPAPEVAPEAAPETLLL